jgi:hypothetical protein
MYAQQRRITAEHDSREEEEQRLASIVCDLEQERLAERASLEERQRSLEAELASLRTFLARKWELQGELEALQHELDNGAVQHTAALHSMRAQVAAERETRRREMEERIAAARRSVAVELHHQLGTRAKAQVAENRQLADELRFQCSEVDKLRAVHAATVQDNKRLLHELRGLSAAGTELVHTSTSLQGVIKDLHSQLQSATATAADPLLMSPVRGDAASDSSIAAAQQQQQQCDSEAQQRAMQQHLAHCISETTAQAVKEEAAAAALQTELQAVEGHNAQTAELRAELLALTQQCCNAASQSNNDTAAIEAWPLREQLVPHNPSDSDSSSIAQALLALLNDRTAAATAALSTAEQQLGRLPLISSAEGRRRQQRTGIPSWDNALAPAIRQVKRSSTRSVAVQTLSYKQQRLCALAAGSSSSCGGCACCAAKASTASLRKACDADVLIIDDSLTAAAAAVDSSSGTKHLHHGTAAHYRAITMRTLHTAVDSRLLHNPFPPRRAVISSNKSSNSSSSTRKQSMKGRTAFVSQRGDSLAGTSLAESSIQGSIQGSIGSITTA